MPMVKTETVGTCSTCGKQSYASKAAAKRAARKVPKRRRGHQNAYRCGNYWHHGHHPWKPGGAT